MAKVIEFVLKSAKAIVPLLLLVVYAFASWAGVEVDLDPEQLWQAVGGAVLVWLVPNKQ